MIIWTSELVALIMQRYTSGESPTVVARELGISRNAVLGRIHRERTKLGLKPLQGNGSNRPKTKRQPKVEQRPIIRTVPVSKPVPMRDENVVFLDIKDAKPILETTGCRWPVGFDETVPGKHLFCNHSIHKRSYCLEHTKANKYTKPESSLNRPKQPLWPVAWSNIQKVPT